MTSFIIGLLFVIDIICAFLLIGIILIQQSKSGGGLGALAGGMGESVFGTAAGNVITKTTVILATVFMVATLLIAIITGHRNEAPSLRERLQESLPVEEALPAGDTESLDLAPVDVPALKDTAAPPADAETKAE
jgi:preprotein translocase subunit SecG